MLCHTFCASVKRASVAWKPDDDNPVRTVAIKQELKFSCFVLENIRANLRSKSFVLSVCSCFYLDACVPTCYYLSRNYSGQRDVFGLQKKLGTSFFWCDDWLCCVMVSISGRFFKKAVLIIIITSMFMLNFLKGTRTRQGILVTCLTRRRVLFQNKIYM